MLRILVVVLIALCALAQDHARAEGQWIWTSEDGPADTWLCLRSSVTLAQVPAKVPVTLAADSTYWLWINGRLVVNAGGLKRGPTPHDTYADEIDLAPFLKPGKNTIAAQVWYWGADGSSHISSGRGGFLMESSVPGFDTGKQWRICKNPAFQHGQPNGSHNVRSEFPVVYDARAELKAGRGDYDDSAWANAVEKGSAPAEPWGRLIPRPIPFFRNSVPRDYVNNEALPAQGPAKVTATLPADLQVYPRLHVEAKAGCEITIHPANAYETTRYITREGDQIFAVPTWGNGESVIYDIPAGVRIVKLDYQETGYDANLEGNFHCSDPALETLWLKCARSAYVNLRDSYMDCPDRERSAWPGDIANTSSAVSYVLDRRADAITAKALREFLNWQSPEGVLWGSVPNGRFRNTYRELPTQSLALIASGFGNYIEQTDDKTLAAEAVPKIRRYLLECWQMNADGLPEPRPTKTGWGAGTIDWMDWGNQIDRRLFETAWYAWALKSLEEMTQVAGLPADPNVTERRASIAAAFDHAFWDDSVKAYRSSGDHDPADDRGNGLAVCAGLVPAQRDTDLIRLLTQRKAASIYTERYPVDALFLLGDPAAAVARLKERYAETIASPLSTLPEMFGKTAGTNHGWGAWPAATIVRYIAGVHPLEPGYSVFAVEPSPAGLTDFNLEFLSVRGRIGVQWKKTQAGATLEVKCPAGSSAHVVFPPVQKWTAITCNGIAAWPQAAADCPVKMISANPPCFQITEGDWRFEGR